MRKIREPKGSGLRAQGSGIVLKGSGLRAQGSERAQGSGLRAQESVLCTAFPVPCSLRSVLCFCALFFTATFSFAQNTTTVTGTLESSGGIVLPYAYWKVQLVNGGSNPVYIDGSPVTQVVTGNADVNGNVTGTIGNTQQIVPSGAAWKWSVCPAASLPTSTSDPQGTCISLPTPLATSSSAFNVSILSSQIGPVAVAASAFSYGTATSQVQASGLQPLPSQPLPGQIYYQVQSDALNYWSPKQNAWVNFAGGSFGGPYLPLAGGTMTGPILSQGTTDYFPGSKNDIRAFGAKCDGSTDDTTDIQNAIYQECGGGGYTANYEPVFVPATVNGCLVTHSLAAGNCPGFTMIGAPSGSLGRTGQASRLLHALVEAYPVLDVSGDPGGLLENFSIQPEGGSVANSQATAGWYARPTTTYEGGGIQVHNVQSIAGNAAGSVGCAAIGQDLGSVDQGSGCSGGYGGAVFGDGAGTSTVASKFYTFGTGEPVTHFTISDTNISGSLDYPLELTGTSGNFTIDHNSYITTILNPSGGAATAAAGIYLDSQTGANGCIDGGNWRVENQGSSATYTGILIGANGATTCRVNATLGAGTYAITLTGSAGISNSNFMVATQATNIFAASGGSITNTTVYAADSAGHLGTVYQSRNFHVYGTLADDPRTTYTTYIATNAYHYNDVICDNGHPSTTGTDSAYCVSDQAPFNMVSNVSIPAVSSQASTGISMGPEPATAFFYNLGAGSLSGRMVYGPSPATSSTTLLDVLMGNTTTAIPVRFNFHDYNAAGSYIYDPAGEHITSSITLINSIRAGTWTITSSTLQAITFATPMSTAPASCSVTPSSSAATTGTPFSGNLSTTGFTVYVPVTGTLSGTYICAVNNAN